MAVLLLTLGGCASTEFAAVNTEPGYYYGFGAGSTEADAQSAALKDLVYTTFTETGSIKKEPKARVVLTDAMKAAVAPLVPKTFLAEKKSPTSFSAVYRIKYADWTKAETARLAALQADLGGRFQALSTDTKKTLGDRLAEAVKVAQAVVFQGVPLALHVGAADSPLLGDALVQWAKAQLAGATIQLQPEGGLINAGQPVTVSLTAGGKALSGLPLTAVWATESNAAPALLPVTDAKGSASVAYPTDQKFRNVKSTLTVTTRMGSLVAEASFLAGLDTGLKAQGAYRNAVVLVQLKVDEVRIEGGTLTGSVKQDRRAGSNEKPRTVSVAPFYMDRTLVTNAQYRSFLETTDVPKDQWPDFLETDDQGAPDQPVVGVSLADAQKYAAWVSGILGVTKRLPTEDEYEIAARAGQTTIFPWGDQPPTDGVRANYAGNKKFPSTSPVGAFPNGANPLGLLDMVGNVWQWTTSAPPAGMTAEPGTVIIKGGSWLESPNELRISNHRAVDPAETASDRGFRLVRSEKS